MGRDVRNISIDFTVELSVPKVQTVMFSTTGTSLQIKFDSITDKGGTISSTFKCRDLFLVDDISDQLVCSCFNK
jgi:hypothetical protein